MIYKSFEGCAPKQNPRVSLGFLTDIVQFSSRLIRLVINVLYVYRFLTAINGLRQRSHFSEDDGDDERIRIRAPYMCATRHHLSVEPDVLELHKHLRQLIYRFKHEVRSIAHTIQHHPHLLFQTVPLLPSTLATLQCHLNDLEMAATFDGKGDQQTKTKRKSHVIAQTRSNNNNNNNILLPTHRTDSVTESVSSKHSHRPMKQKQSPQQSGYARRIESDEEQVYLISRNIHLALHTLFINTKLIHLTTKDGMRAGMSTLLFPFLYDIAKKCCLSFHHLQLLSKYVSHRAVQSENRPAPPLTDFRVNSSPANRNIITEAHQNLVDNFAKTVKKRTVRFHVATEQCLPSSVLTRRFSDVHKLTKSRV